MANDISSNIWRIDTVPFTYAFPVKIIMANWTDQANINDRLLVKQSNGKPLFDSQAQQTNFQQNFGNQGWVSGITLVNLDSGVLTLAVGGGK